MLHQPGDFATKLDRVMIECNLSRVALARELGLDKSVIARWLTGVNRPTDHNLTRLTEVVRRHRPELTLAFWRDVRPADAIAVDAASAGAGPALTGLALSPQAEVDANYVGLWAGFYQATQNTGCVILAAFEIARGPRDLRGAFTDGRVRADGSVIAMGPRLHAILEIAPMHDRLCLLVLNGVASRATSVMEGVYATSAGEAEVCASASPVLLFRVATLDEVETVGGLAALMPAIQALNVRNVAMCVEAGEPVAGLCDLAPEAMLRLVCPQIGVARTDGEIDHVLRMPKHRSPHHGRFSADEMPSTSPVLTTIRRLRAALGLAQVS